MLNEFLVFKKYAGQRKVLRALKDVVGQVKELGSRDYQEKVVFALIDRSNLFPFNGYPLFGSQEEDDTFFAELIEEGLKEDLVALQAGECVKLCPPKKEVDQKQKRG